MSLRPFPRFFIVGAAKCGTSAMQHYLRQHPQIFMPEMKEIHHFAPDLLHPGDPFLDRGRYLELFAPAQAGQVVGEASVFYLLSEVAAAEIRHAVPDGRIVIMLRHPVDVAYALHSQLVYNGEEDIADFAAALAVTEERRAGRRAPAHTRIARKHVYLDVVRFSPQVERFLVAFGRDRVHIVLYEDLRADTGGEFRRLCRFLGVADDVAVQFERVNRNKAVRLPSLQRGLAHPPASLRRLARLFPDTLREGVKGALGRFNASERPRLPLDPELRARLTADLHEEILRLGQLTGRDLSHWLAR